jgi:hypothetical protein
MKTVCENLCLSVAERFAIKTPMRFLAGCSVNDNPQIQGVRVSQSASNQCGGSNCQAQTRKYLTMNCLRNNHHSFGSGSVKVSQTSTLTCKAGRSGSYGGFSQALIQAIDLHRWTQIKPLRLFFPICVCLCLSVACTSHFEVVFNGLWGRKLFTPAAA